MKITEVECILLTVPAKWAAGVRAQNFSLVRVKTDAGIVGWGETLAGYYVPEIVPALVAHYREVVLGRNPLEINRLWQEMFVKSVRWGHTGTAITVLGAIEMALWDILGRALGVPVSQLLGGAIHDRMRCYASTGAPAYPFQRTLDHAKELADQGFTALKTGQGLLGRPQPLAVAPFVEQERAKIAALRQALGADVDLMLDPATPFSRSPWPVDLALQIVKALDDFNLLWVEQPLLQTNVDDYVRLRQFVRTPLAAGENGTTLHDFKLFLEKRAIDVVQPDAAWCGGIGEMVRIIAAAEARDMRVAPHCFSSAVGLAANYHVAFATRSCFIVELPTSSNPMVRDLITSIFPYKNGYLSPSQAPGLGVEITDEMIARYPFVPGTGMSHARSPYPKPVPEGFVERLASESLLPW